jgi:hypothetical protein
MRVFDITDAESRQGDRGKYMVYVGGYPRETMPTFEEAAARAWELSSFEQDDDFSIYEVDTWIHFDVPRSPRGDMRAEVFFRLPVDFGLR